MSLRHITFVRPNLSDMRSSDAMAPLVFGILAARTPPDIALSLYDDHLEAIPYHAPTDLVAITVDTFSARRAYEIAARYRERGVPVVVGGHHPSLLPAEALEYCDSVVVGDAEGSWEQVVRDASAGKLKSLYQAAQPPDLAGPPPARTIFRGKRYGPLALVQYGRGCRFACEFCSVHAFYGERLTQRPVQEVVEEIRAMGSKLVFFVDDNIFANVERAEELFRGLTPLGIRWVCQASIDIARHRRLVPLMARSGCIAVLLGFESLSAENLRQMNKRCNLRSFGYEQAIARLHRHGIMIYGTFVFGYDHDSADAFKHTVEFAIRSGFLLANFNPLTPTPGTDLYRRLEREGSLLYPRWWLDPAYRYGQAIFEPKGMSAAQLTDGCLRARRQFYSYRTLLGRLTQVPRHMLRPYNLGLYMLANLVSRREILRKQGAALGTGAGESPQRRSA